MNTMTKKILSFLLAAVCYLGCHNGYLAVFDEKKRDPLLVLPYKTDTYSPEDRAALTQGIYCEDMAALTQVLEDFLS